MIKSIYQPVLTVLRKAPAKVRERIEAFNAQIVAATQRVISQIETFTNITFTQTNDSSAEITFAQSTRTANVGAWACATLLKDCQALRQVLSTV